MGSRLGSTLVNNFMEYQIITHFKTKGKYIMYMYTNDWFIITKTEE